MKKQRILSLVSVIIICISSTGCAFFDEARSVLRPQGTQNRLAANGKTDPYDDATQADALDYALLIENDYIKPGMYEPETGCYLGIDMWRDKRVSGGVTAFDELSKKAHAIYAVSVDLGEGLPLEELLQCIAAQKTPFVTINPPAGANPYDEEKLLLTAAELSKYNVPMFINFFPYSKKIGYGAESYKRFFRKAWLIFKEWAPNAAMVFCANVFDGSSVYDYYPGSSYVEWVGAHMEVSIQNGGYSDFVALFDDFYQSFQDSKPIAVILAISHFSTADNSYYTEICAETLSGFYDYIATRMPRVKAVVYNDYSDIQSATRAVRNNYLLTDEDLILESYQSAIAPDFFLSVLTEAPSSGAGQFTRSNSGAAYIDGVAYITEKSILSYTDGYVPPIQQSRYISGEKCFAASAIGSYIDGHFEVYTDKKVMFWLLE